MHCAVGVTIATSAIFRLTPRSFALASRSEAELVLFVLS